jgi:DNA processing protein
MPATIPAANGSSTLPEEAYATALASVPGIGPRSLRVLLEDATPRAAWDKLLEGKVHLVASRQEGSAIGHARKMDVVALWEAHQHAGIAVCVLGRPGYPAVLAEDPQAPAVLFSIGRPAVLDRAPRVAVVGTRSATRYGLGVAAQLGADLAAAGVVVVSGLALGIDGAAHEGAVAAWNAACGDGPDGAASLEANPRAPVRRDTRAATPVAVVAGSVSTPYPRQHARLWRRVADAGAVVSESPIGVADLAWRFPLRNRIIAAISDVVVVVECHVRGGSLHTVEAATARGVAVGAVPGSVRSPASAGTNELIADGCFVVRDASDVLAAVGIASAGSGGGSGDRITLGVDVDKLPSPTADVARAVGWDPTPLEEILGRTGLGMDVVCEALERLRACGLVHGEGGCWERV